MQVALFPGAYPGTGTVDTLNDVMPLSSLRMDVFTNMTDSAVALHPLYHCQLATGAQFYGPVSSLRGCFHANVRVGD